jgi:shikimate kinase
VGLIYLTGMPGCGKSSVGKSLAVLRGEAFADLDELIVARVGMSIAEIFERRGEAAFRQSESELLRETAASSSGVIALGGGTLVDTANLDFVTHSGRLVYIATPLAAIRERIGSAGGRPLLTGTTEPDDFDRRLRELWELRHRTYEQAEIVVWSGMTTSIDDVVRQIAERLSAA